MHFVFCNFVLEIWWAEIVLSEGMWRWVSDNSLTLFGATIKYWKWESIRESVRQVIRNHDKEVEETDCMWNKNSINKAERQKLSERGFN